MNNIRKLQDILFFVYAGIIGYLAYSYFMLNIPLGGFFVGYLMFDTVFNMYQSQKLHEEIRNLKGENNERQD